MHKTAASPQAAHQADGTSVNDEMDAKVWLISHKQDYTSNSLNVGQLFRGLFSRNYYGY